MSRLRRFLHIERSRTARPEDGAADPSAATAGRIGGVERPGTGPAAPASSGAGLERFAPPPPPSIELVSTEAGERPFTRCMRCGMDHNVFATECSGCGASLDTAPQREFNERLWAARQEESARERRASEERAAERARDGAGAGSMRAMGEALAREVGEHERRRLEVEGLGRRIRWWGDGALLWAAMVALGRAVRSVWRRLTRADPG